MNTFSADLHIIRFPPKQKKVQEVGADVVLIDPVVINHSAETLDGENSDVSVFV